MASNIGAVAGVAFVDQAGDGLTGDDPRLEGITVQLFQDTNTNGTFDSGTDALIGTDTTATSADPEPGEYRFDSLAPGDYFVVQAAQAGLVSPDPILVSVVDDDGTQVAVIDDYTLTSQNATADGTTTTVSSSSAAPEALGGNRDIQATQTGGGSTLEIQVDATTDLLSVSAGAGTTGEALIQYDGADGTITLDPDGLSGVSLTGQAVLPANASFVVQSFADIAGATVEVRVFTDATNFSTSTFNIPANTSVQETLLPMSSFSVGGGTGADFNSVGAIEVEVTSAANVDSFVSIVETIVPTVVTQGLANTQQMTLGGELFLDNGPNAGEQNNGSRDASEAGVATGTAVDLYQVNGPTDTVNPGTDTPIASTTTGANGAYSFPNLDPGNYVVVIPDSNFTGGGNLVGHGTSTGNDPASDPDDNVDGDDNGLDQAGLGVVAQAITLVSNNEPINDGDTDANTNNTVDFGLIPEVDLDITKTINTALSDDFAGGTVVFDITVLNNGPLDATSVEVEDVIPAGLTFDATSSNFNGFTPSVVGSTVTVDVGTIIATNSATFQIAATIDAGQTADVTNTATVSTDDQVDTDGSNDSSSVVVDLQEADLAIVKSDGGAGVNAGGQLTYTLTVTNNGPDAAAGVQAFDTLDADLTFVSGNVGGNATLVSFDSGTRVVTANIGALASGTSATVEIVVDVATGATSPLANTATVQSSPDTDPDASDNSSSVNTTVAQAVDVEISKQISTTGPIAGGAAFTYTVTVENNGPSNAVDVEVTDDLDDFLTLVNGSFNDNGSGTTISQDGTDPTLLTFDVGTLAPGAANAVTFSFDVTLDAAATGTLSNTASVTTTSNDTDNTNDSATVNATISRDVTLGITKAVNVTTATPGAFVTGTPQLEYTLTVSNTGTSDALNVQVLDDFNDDVTAGRLQPTVVSSADGTVTNTNNVAQIDFTSIPAGESRTITITADVPAAGTGDIVNSATVDSDDTAVTTSNTVTTTLDPQYDLEIDKTVQGTATSFGPGDTVTFNLVVSHDLNDDGTETDNGESPSTATGVVVTDTLPTGLTFVSATSGGSSVTPTSTTGGQIVLPAFDLAPGATRTLTITATVDDDADGALTNSATLAAADDTQADNNTDTQDITAVPEVDLTITKSVDSTEAQTGATLQYTVTVTNNGPSPAEGVEAVDTLPAGVTFVSGVGPANEALSESGGTVTVAIGTMAANTSATFTIDVTIDSTATGNLANSVAVTTTTSEPVTNNNQASATTTVDPETSTIAGTVYVDTNGNGTQDTGEDGIAGVELVLSGTDSLGNAVSQTQTTDASGNYQFTLLPQGSYTITQTQPAGFRTSDEVAGTGATNVTSNDNVFQFDLGQDDDAIDFDFTELAEALSKRRFLASST